MNLVRVRVNPTNPNVSARREKKLCCSGCTSLTIYISRPNGELFYSIWPWYIYISTDIYFITTIYILYDIWNKRLIASLHTSNPKYNIKIGKRINIYNEHGEKIKPYNLEYVEHLNIDFNGNYNYLFTIDNYYFFCNAENSICAYKVNDKFTEILSEKNFGKKFTLKTTEIIYYVNTNNVKIHVSESNIIINSKINNIDFLYSTVHKLKKTIINWI